MGGQDLQHLRSNFFGKRTGNSNLDHARQATAAERKKPGEVKVLSENHGTSPQGFIKNQRIGIARIADFSPVKDLM